MEQESFKDSRVYPILFMMIITIIFVGILAFFYHSTKTRVKDYEVNTLKKTVLNVFEIPTDQIEKNYSLYIREVDKNQIHYYQAHKDSVLLGNAFIIQGKGLWGGITAMIAYSPDYQKIINFAIINQNETPGLGARITEDWFTGQFSKKQVIKDKQFTAFELVSENKDDLSDVQIRQVTGATLSSKSVLNMISDESKRIIQQLKGEL